MKTITRYILGETIPPTILGIFVLTLIVIGQQLVKISDYLITGGVPVREMGKLIIYSLPAFLEISIPISLILGITIAFSRLSIDSEMIAMRASGVGLGRILPGVAIIAFLGFAAVSALTLYGSAYGYRNFYNTLRKISIYGSREVIKEGVFSKLGESTLIYTEHISPDGKRLWGVLISEKRGTDEPIIITAKEGEKFYSSGGEGGSLVLRKGVMNQKLPDGSQRILVFDRLTFKLNGSKKTPRGIARKPKEMSLPSIISLLKTKKIPRGNIPSYLFSLHKRLSLPFASIIFSFFAVPLGMAQRSRGKSASFIVTGVVVLVYYLFIGIAQSLKGISLPLALGMIWLPNILFGIVTVIFIRKIDEDPSFQEKLSRIFRRSR